MQWPVPTQLPAVTHVFIAVVCEHVWVPVALHMLLVQWHPQRLLLYAAHAHPSCTAKAGTGAALRVCWVAL